MKQLILALLPIAFAICTANHTRVDRSAVNYVWPGGVIPYVFSSDLGNNALQTFLRATKYIEDRTCLKFPQKKSSDQYFLTVIKEGCCWAEMGRRPGSAGKGQRMSMGGGDGEILPFYLHELGHVIAFPHEQDRPDRDDYIYWDRNKNEMCRKTPDQNFSDKVNELDQAAVDIPFDYLSLMADWTECYWPKWQNTPKEIPLGPGKSDDRTFSVLDIERINAIYDCKGCYAYRFKKISHLAQNQMPVAGGYELNGNTFHICRVYHEGHLLIGKSLPDNNKCWVGFDQGEKEYNDNFSVLTNPRNEANLRWIKSSGNRPSNAIKGGRTKDRETIYIGRCLMTVGNDKTLIPGYYLESNPRELRISFGGGVTKCTDFEILVCN